MKKAILFNDEVPLGLKRFLEGRMEIDFCLYHDSSSPKYVADMIRDSGYDLVVLRDSGELDSSASILTVDKTPETVRRLRRSYRGDIAVWYASGSSDKSVEMFEAGADFVVEPNTIQRFLRSYSEGRTDHALINPARAERNVA